MAPPAVRGIAILSTLCGFALHASAQTPPPATLVYQNDFSKPVGDEWSHKKTSETPTGKRPFLGQFVEDSVNLTLKTLPEHRLLRVSFDLFLIRCWDGSSKTWGAKIWDMGVVRGPMLIHSTFCNAGFFGDNNEQSFPDIYPWKPYPAWTGSSEHQTLGYIQSWGGPERTFDTDSVYHFELAFPHRDRQAVLRFTSIMEGKKDKGWGLAKVKVETLADFARLDEKTLAALWEDLAGTEPMKAFHASWALIAAGDQAVEFIKPRLGGRVDEDAIAKLVAQLDDDSYAVREQASKQLGRQPAEALPMIRKAMADATSGEVRSRLEAILNAHAAEAGTPEERRNARALHVLEVIDTDAARAVRQAMPLAPQQGTHDAPGIP